VIEYSLVFALLSGMSGFDSISCLSAVKRNPIPIVILFTADQSEMF
jgi:hypothetical protein